jgi:hypothetical protein
VTPGFRYALLWIAGSLALVVAALATLPGSLLQGVYVPSNPDAFYHARRILDVVMTGEPVQQFDARIHVPEGALISWPWGFDAALAEIVRLFGPFTGEAAATRVLMHVPVAFTPLAVALLITLARQLGLGALSTVLMTIGFVSLPLVFLAFGVGNVDHHFAELLWTVLALSSGVAFMRTGRNLVPALLAGAALGTAVAAHNGLFILQLPLVCAFAWRWVRCEPLPPLRSAAAFAATLIGITALVSVPSLSWRSGAFEFYTLSWFHTYVAVCSAALVLVCARFAATRRTIALVGIAAVGAAVPLLGALGLGTRFVSGELDVLRDVTEAMSPYELYALFGPAQSTQLFSWLMWLSLPAALVNAYWVVRAHEPGRQFFAVSSLLYLALMQMQYRFGVLGVVPLLGTLALLLETAGRRWPSGARLQGLSALAALIVALLPTGAVWTTPRAAGGDPLYADLYPGLMSLREVCAERPALVLAGINDGHWVRYHTQCSTIGNVFLLTGQDARKRLEVESLLALSPERLRAERSDIDYVLVHSELELFVPINADGSHGPGRIRWRRETLPALVRALLAEEAALPAGYRALWTSYTAEGDVFARLLAVER